jgi:hypothetical protein
LKKSAASLQRSFFLRPLVNVNLDLSEVTHVLRVRPIQEGLRIFELAQITDIKPYRSAACQHDINLEPHRFRRREPVWCSSRLALNSFM